MLMVAPLHHENTKLKLEITKLLYLLQFACA